MPTRVFALEFDDRNEREIHRHRVNRTEISQVLDDDPVLFPNKKGHRAQLIMIGRTNGGRLLTVPIAVVDEEAGLWRPATAWDADADEAARYFRSGRR